MFGVCCISLAAYPYLLYCLVEYCCACVIYVLSQSLARLLLSRGHTTGRKCALNRRFDSRSSSLRKGSRCRWQRESATIRKLLSWLNKNKIDGLRIRVQAAAVAFVAPTTATRNQSGSGIATKLKLAGLWELNNFLMSCLIDCKAAAVARF